MIHHIEKFGFIAIVLVLPLTGHAAPPKTTNAVPQEKIQATFMIPRTQNEGRDPFYPDATSVYQTAAAASKSVPDTGLSLLRLKGILGSTFVQINNVTLGVGETQEVKTAAGPVSVHLLEIHAADSSVTIEANGQRRQLHYGDSLARKEQ
jgi:hypothetical protein